MGNGCGKNATPTALKGYRREITLKEISVTSRINKDETKDALKNTTQNEHDVVRNGTVSSKVQVREKVPQNQQGEEFAAEKQEDVAVESVNEGTQESRKTEQSQNDYLETKIVEEKQEVAQNGKDKSENKAESPMLDTISTDNCNEDNDHDFVRTSYGISTSPWPVRSYGKFSIPLNVNAHHGGCTALLFNSVLYGKGSNVELMMIRCGFDCNHMQVTSVAKINNGHFGSAIYHTRDEDGTYVIDCLFGTNHYMYLSNESMNGNLRNGVFAEIPEGSTEVIFPLNVNGNRNEYGIGLTLILASGMDNQTPLNGLYIVRSGSNDNSFESKLISGEDKFKFSATDDGMLRAEGPSGCRFSLFHNRDNLTPPTVQTYVSQTQTIDGKEKVKLSGTIAGHSTFVVLCSNSNGTEDNTASSVYHVNVADGKVTSALEVCGSHGPEYEKSDLWTFEMIPDSTLSVNGPTGPCKYGVMSNIKSSCQELYRSINQTQCLATGEENKTYGYIDNKTLEEIKGSINKPSDVCIMLNHKVIETIRSKDLKNEGARHLFFHKWKLNEICVGYHLIRVFAVRKNTFTGEDVFLEMKGSPFSLTRQKPGVVYALNCAGPAYQDMNDIVYASEHRLFANFDPNFERGHRCKAVGSIKPQVKLPASMLKSHDGFMYAVARSNFNQDETDTRFVYKVYDLPNGKFILRLHLIGEIRDLKVNGTPVGKKIQEELKKIKKPGDLIGPSCYCVNIDVEIKDNRLELYDRTNSVYTHGDYVCAFALLDQTYKDNVISEKEIEEMQKEKLLLADSVLPISTNTTKKVMTIVGWSPNLLLNASGENLDMKYWNTKGNFKIGEYAGAATEKVLITSHMWCEKYQEVNLLDHFSEAYIDTAPDIQVSEMYREGHCDGGFYKMTVQLMKEDGTIIAEYNTGQIGSIQAGGKWHEALHVFSDYGPGVRIVAFSSAGKDNKYWAGHFGVMMSSAQIRVRNESKTAEGDSYTDITKEEDSSKKRVELEKIVTKILSDNKDLADEFVQDESIPVDENFEKQTAMVKKIVNQGPRRRKLKKREIRIFVSSTFRDFSAEREHIIKKAFREINRLCQDRGVFFTYVDLRWGITSEQTNGGKTISICLQEIDKCRPYFICLMGERYGWSQRKEKEDEVLNKTFDNAIETSPNLRWVENYRYDSSITELEVLHGVLNHTDGPLDKCRFYMRDPPSKEDYTEEEYKRLVSESEWHSQQQEDLKARVKAIKGIRIKAFKTAPEVSEYIKEDLKGIIDEEFPLGTELTRLEQQREAHQAFASARCRVYIGRQDYFKEINKNRDKQITSPFVILGESGSGKSALVANWTKQVEDAEPDTFLFKHFIGSSAESADYLKMIRRLFEEIKDFFKFELDIPSADSVLIRDVDKWLRMAGAVSKVVIVFDALNQLDDGTGEEGTEHDLQWIPTEIPHNVFLLVSTLPGRAMNACIQSEWPSMKVEPLQDSQKMQIITDYLEGIYSKTLTTEQKEMIVNVKQTSNPLYLKSLLDEVRMYGSFRTLTNKILEYLSAESPQDLFAKILERLEDDYEIGENARKDLVCDSTSALWCANRGMSESELVEFLNIPGAVWSPFYLSLYENIVNRNGLLSFFHDHLRRAVEKKYLSTDELKKKFYLKLADFYDDKDISNRTVEELPFLLARAGEMVRLKKTVSNLDVFQRLSSNEDGLFELIKAWNTLGGFALSEEAYMTELSKVPREVIVKNADYYCKLYGKMGKFFLNLGLMEAAKSVYKTLIKQLESHYGESHGTIVYNAFGHDWKYRCKHPDVIKALHDLGTVYSQLGEIDQAIVVDNDAINRQNRITTPSEMLRLCEGFLGLSAVYVQKDDMTEAKKLVTRALELATSVLGKKHHYVAAILTKLGQISYKQGRVDEALAYYMQDMKMTRSEVGINHPRTAIVLNEIGLVYDDKNDKMAQKIYEAALSIILETYGSDYLGTGTIRYNLGASYYGTNLFLKAKFQFLESYRIHQMFLGDDHPDTKSVKEALETVTAATR